MAVLFIVIHLLICIVGYLLMRFNILKSSRMVVMLMFFVPVWGLGCLLVLELRTRIKKDSYEEVGVEKLLINDEIHRSILMDEDATVNSVLPLGEAFLMNDASTQRELMMEVMYTDPNDYVSQLQDARMSGDTEVVHYAVTALVEMQKDYDLQFQKLDRMLAEDPDDDKVLNDYISLMERFLQSGLANGNAKKMYLRNYIDLLDRKLNKGENAALWSKKIEAVLSVEDYDVAYEGIRHMIDMWRGYLYLLRYFAIVRDRDGIDRVLEMIQRRKVYLTPAGRNAIRFWSASSGEAMEEEESVR